MTTQTYLACTLGPVGRTLLQQRRTRSIFAASYLFSFLMKGLLNALKTKGLQGQVLTPSPDFLGDSAFENLGCGLYSDRLIMLSQHADDWQKLQEARQEVLALLAGPKGFGSYHGSIDQAYLEAYLKIYLLEITVPVGDKTIEQINQQLDQLELLENFPFGADDDPLLAFFAEAKGHFLLRDAFGTGSRDRFPTLAEIATRELEREPGNLHDYEEIVQNEIELRLVAQAKDLPPGKDEDDFFYEGLRARFEDQLKPYHKYVAVVNVDGDNFSRYIEGIGAKNVEFQAFSHNLMQFGKKAYEAIKDYGGAPVYIGGDDLLFFAPVASIKETEPDKRVHIFDLIRELDTWFHHFFPPSAGSPTLSYGISLSYHKFPLNEALKESEALLEKIKENKMPKLQKKLPAKNGIAFKVLKHSGQYFEAVIDKNETDLYRQFQDLLVHIQAPTFINSLTHGMAFFQDLFETLLLGQMPPEAAAIQHLFDNTFNESIHHQNRDFINQVAEYVVTVYAYMRKNQQAYLPDNEEKATHTEKMSKAALALIYSTLRFIHFVGHSSTQNVVVHD